MGYGGSASQYTEGKRVVMDKYIGPLIATEMTRCIHCTRCVRFGEEIAGIRELGATGRGENVRIGTYIAKSVVSEVSGNVIDICPVGALTARPSRYTARAWELRQHVSVAPHDSVGSNVLVHMDGEKVNRVVPRDNDDINETWISDRDRFSYQGLNSADRLSTPMIRVDGELQNCDWSTALEKAAQVLAGDAQQLGVLASASLSVEELYLTQKLARAAGSANIDHRLSQTDFSTQDASPAMPWLGMQLSDLETLDAALLVGSNIRKDQPIAALRLRKSALKGGQISFINPRAFEMHFDAADNISVRSDAMLAELACVATAAGADISALKNAPSFDVTEQHQRIADALKNGERCAVMLGNIAVAHPVYAQLEYVAKQLASATGATLSLLPEKSNTAGACLAGVLPHREVGGAKASAQGLNARDMLEQGLDRYLLVGCELEFDASNPAMAMQALNNAKGVVAINAFMSDSLKAHADVILPMATFTESYGTFVNATGNWQTAKGICAPPGDARPAWKVLRVLAEALELDGFGYDSPDAITKELQQACSSVQLNNLTPFSGELSYSEADSSLFLRSGETPIHAIDPLVRRSQPLQKSADGKQAFALMAASELSRLKLEDGDSVSLKQGANAVTLPVQLSDELPEGCVWVPRGIPETQTLGDLYASIEVSKA